MSAALEEEIAAMVCPSIALENRGIVIDGGVKVDFRRYPYLPEIIDAHSDRTTIIKGAQMGFTIACVLRCLEEARTGDLRGILYLFPTDTEVQDFSKARFSPLMDNNQHVWGPDVVGNTDAAGLKEIGGTFVYFRGAGQKGGAVAKSTSRLKSIPIDRLYMDERDEMDDSRVDAAIHRLDGSMCAEQTSLSTPTLPGYGVDYDFQSSDQRGWLWQCTHCNAWVSLEDTYPDCIAEPVNEDPFYICNKCKDPLERLRGEWVARKPDVRGHRGYWASQLCSPTKTARDIVIAATAAADNGRMREFYNQNLARAYADVDDEITEEQLEACLRDEAKPLRHEGPAAMGVDPGAVHHYEVRVRTSEHDTLQIARGQADSYEELSRIAKKYNVQSGVMDQGFDPTSVRNFVREHPGWWGCLFVNAKRTDPDYNHKDRVVKVGREWALDAAHHEIIEKRVSFYQKDDGWPEFVAQMTNLKRAVIENQITGQRTPRWSVTGGKKNDHLRCAGAYCAIAAKRVPLVKSIRDLHKRHATQKRGARNRSAMTL